jgi:DNA-binding NarL/FixJ family response regulator
MLRILIIDCNLTFRQSLTELLAKHFPEMEIRTLGNPARCPDLLRDTERLNPDVILADMHTLSDHAPGFARTIKEGFPQRTLVLMSSFDMPEYRRAAYDSGADYCLLKDESTFAGIAGLVTFLRGKLHGRE